MGPNIIVFYILPSLLGGLIYLLLAQFFIFIFRIKKPSIKYLMYFLVLYKSLLVLIMGARYSFTTVPRKPFGFGFMFYDPLDLLPLGSIGPMIQDNKSLGALHSNWLATVISITVIIIAALLLLRWIATAWFLSKVAKDKEEPNLLIKSLVKDLCANLKIKTPSIFLSKEDIGPLSIGVIKPTIILPKKLTNLLKENELEIVLGHELAHIKRRDNLWQWLILFMKDLLFFNPFSRLTYNFLQANKEVATDLVFLGTTPKKNSLLQKTIQKVAQIQNSNKGDLLIAKANFLDAKIIQKRLSILHRANIKAFKDTWLRKTASIICILLFFWVKIWVAVKLGQKALMLLS